MTVDKWQSLKILWEVCLEFWTYKKRGPCTVQKYTGYIKTNICIIFHLFKGIMTKMVFCLRTPKKDILYFQNSNEVQEVEWWWHILYTPPPLFFNYSLKTLNNIGKAIEFLFIPHFSMDKCDQRDLILTFNFRDTAFKIGHTKKNTYCFCILLHKVWWFKTLL